MTCIIPLRIVPALVAKAVRLNPANANLIRPLPISSLDDPEQVDAELGHP